MRMMTKRILSLLLCFVLVVGLVPATALAADTVLDAAIFCSDVHGNASTVSTVFSKIKTADSTFAPSTASFVGDTECAASSVTTQAQSVYSDIACYYAYGSHDSGCGIDDVTGVLYNGTNYAIYSISQTDMESYSKAKTASAGFASDIADVDASKPLFVISHMPLHARRKDNDGAGFWCDAINAAAGSRDIVFFWAHNHTGESNTDTAAYYLAKGSSITVEDDSSDSSDSSATSSKTLAFTYMNAGFIGKSAGRGGYVTTVKIYGDSMVFQDYNSSGAVSDNSYTHNVTVTREFAAEEVTLSSIVISGETEYFVGDELALTVTATYSDGTTADVTADAEIAGYDMTAAGTQIVTATYGEKTATVEITVTAVQINSIAVTTQPTKLTYATGEELDTTGMVVTATYNNGTTAEVTGWYTSTVDMTTAGEKTVTVNYMVDGITYKTTFTITVEEQVAADATLTALEIVTEPEKTEYLVSQALDISGMVVEATFSDGTVKTLTYKGLAAEGADTTYCYEITGFNMYKAAEKGQVVTVSYSFNGGEALTDTYIINVWEENFTSDAGVSVAVTDDYGVTGATVTESANKNVAAAVADVISGDNYVAYDISLTFDEGYATTNVAKTVSLPIPEGVNNPVVYYVSDDGATVTNMNATKGDGVVTFTTTHFSTYVVGESTEITVPNPETEYVEGTGSTTAYVLADSLTAGGEYLIVNINSTGDGYALLNNSGSVSTVPVTVQQSGDDYYIELDNSNAVWTATTKSSGYELMNGSYYLEAYGSTSAISISTSQAYSSRYWNYSSSALGYYGGNSTHYIYYSSGFASQKSSDTIYIYQKQDFSTSVTGTYAIAGNPAELKQVVEAGSTATLGYTITFTPEGSTTAQTLTETQVTALGGTVTYSEVDGGDPSSILTVTEAGAVTFSGTTGKALVKVSYTWGDNNEYTIDNYITVEASEPYYTIDILDGETVVTGTTITEKGVTSTTTLQLGTQIKFFDGDPAEGEVIDIPEAATLEWNIPEEYHNIATVDENGLITFKGVDGAFYVTVTLTVDGKDYTVGVNISATTSQYSVPSDGTTDFPEYPNEGAIRYDKTATAVGNFSETGIAQVELSMTGVPYTTGSEIDVVLMLDMTGSMSANDMIAAEEAAIVFAQSIVLNEDGTYNNNRVAVYAFNIGENSQQGGQQGGQQGTSSDPDSGETYELWTLGTITADTWSSFCTAVRTASDNQENGGTPYSVATNKCYDILNAAKTDGIGNNRSQFCVFVSDGDPTSMYHITDVDTATDTDNDGIKNYTKVSGTSTTYPEYYTQLMKDQGVTMYTVGTGITSGSNAATILANMASDSNKAYIVASSSDQSGLSSVFSNIGSEIRQAATDVTVEDKITDEYTMIFDIPTGFNTISGVTNDFYIEFVKYTLDATTHERTGAETSVTKLYLKNTSGVYSAAKDSDGTAYDAPVFENKVIGEKGTLYYWTTDSSYASKAAVSYNDGTNTYYFIPYGIKATDSAYDSTKWFNMTSGGYASGTVNTDTNMSEDLVIATPYFVYNAETKMIYWTVDKLENATTEYALRYFLYLDNSATEVGTDNETDPGSYPTNDHAYITYTNFRKSECRQEFPVPQLTWSGAQVSYVFYLVNAAGQPINKSGQVVDFANATFVTDVYTESTVWNKGEDGQITADSKLSIDWLAANLLPSDYKVYDEAASYKLHVFGSHTGESIFDYFIIDGSDAATISSSLNSRLNLSTTTASVETTKVYNTKAGTKYDDYGTYTSEATNQYTDEIVLADFDFYNTTVAFAVVWQPKLVEDTIVVDYGLDVLVDVVENDMMQNTVTGIGLGKDAYGSIAMNTGVSTTSELGTAALTIDGNTISIENENAVRFSQGDMEFKDPVTFYYESPVEFWESSNKQEGYMYSSVTVIPATTVYYEDDFVTLTTETKGDNGWTVDTTSGWSDGSDSSSALQATDRIGDWFGFATDANNVYGYDGAYDSCSEFSLGSAAMVNVTSGHRARAAFNFYGTGFDVISLTSNTTGTITVNVYPLAAEAYDAETLAYSYVVDTYYGYTQNADGEWEISENTPNALYQVPVMKVEDLAYGGYHVEIVAAYSRVFDHNTSASGYDIYLDAVRIYDPTGVVSGDTTNDTDGVVSGAYNADGEAWPAYQELRNNVIMASEYNITSSTDENGKITVTITDDDMDDKIKGAVFIDSEDDNYNIADYVSYGPNNELYLDNEQAIAFNVAMTDTVADVQLGIKVANNDTVTYEINGDSYTVNSATDMYYSILDYAKAGTVVIENVSGGILSLTNIKVTYTEAPSSGVAEANLLWMDGETAGIALMSLRSTPAADEEEVPETTVPEETEPETTVPEETEPETTVPEETEPETTVPEETEPETTVPEITPDAVANTIRKIVDKITNALNNLFGRWFR